MAFEQPVAAFAFGTGRSTSTENTATKTTSMVANPKIVRFIHILLGYVLVASQITALQYPCFDLFLTHSGQETTHIRVGANLTCVSPAPAPTVQMGCRNRQIPLGFSIMLIRKRKAMGRKEKAPLQWVIVESTP